MPDQQIALSWSLGHYHGWGIYGLNLVFAMLRREMRPLLLRSPGRLALHPLEMAVLLPVLEHSQETITSLVRHPEAMIHAADTLLLHHTDGRFAFSPISFSGRAVVGVTFFESTNLAPEAISKAKQLPLVITGSRWNERVLTEKYGLTNVRYIMQGVDVSRFYPSVSNELLAKRFVIFSGGKLEYRKGQDLVVAAFQKFHAQHPDAFLLTAWNNKWLTADARFDGRHLHGLPENNDINAWLGQHLPAGSFLDIGEVPNPMTAAILREAHVGVFPNRCEGGTNLVAMECMAVGVPVILACNTGHLDLIDPERCYPLLQQGPCMDPQTGYHLVDWGESSVDEIVAYLEEIYTSPSEACRRGMNGSDFIRGYSWQRQCDQLLDLLSTV